MAAQPASDRCQRQLAQAATHALPIQLPGGDHLAARRVDPVALRTEMPPIPGSKDTTIDVHAVMASLARTRPVFHSEADFQHAFAWHVHQTMPDQQVRLECRPLPDQRLYVDLWLPTMRLAVELKYRTRKLALLHAGERYDLRQQGACDIGRYDFCKDIRRVELLHDGPAVAGFAVLLTNEHLYWSPPQSPGKVDEAFHVHHGRHLSGSLAWSPRAGRGTTRSREEPIDLAHAYNLVWHDYARVDASRTANSASPRSNTLFRYLCVQVPTGF